MLKNSDVQLRFGQSEGVESRKVLRVERVDCGVGFGLLRTAVYKRRKANLRFSRISKWRPKCVRLLFCTNPGAFLSMSTEEEIRTQNDRLELLLNLTSKITSSLDLREQRARGSGRTCRSNGKRLNLKDVSSCHTDEISTMVKNWTAAALRNARERAKTSLVNL